MSTLPKKIVLLFTLLSFILAACSSSRTIVNGIEEKEANEILVYLNNKGIQATKAATAVTGSGGQQKAVLYDIQVPETQANEAMALLNIAGLPRKRGQSLLGIFAGGGLVPSQMEEKIRFQQGLAEQIASTLRKIDGVIDADVLLTFPEEDPLNPDKAKGKITAAVFIKHNGILDDPNANLVSKIKRLVASSIPSLDYENVTVIGDRARNTNFIPETTANASQEKMVDVWSMSLAENSLRKFQIIFFTLISATILLLLFLIWLIWKCFPVIKQAGGMKSLLKAHPFHVDVDSAPANDTSGDQDAAKEESEESNREISGLEPDTESEEENPQPKK